MTDDAPAAGRQRADRLRIAVLAADPAELSQALRRMPTHLTDAIAKQVGVPAPVLRRDPAPARFLRRTEAAPVFSTVADAMVGPCLDACIELLGRAADDPTLNQLRAAVDALAEDFPPATIALMLAATAASDAPAAEACEQILADDERFALPDEVPEEVLAPARPAAPAAPAPAPSGADDAAREERRARRAARKAEERARQQRAREAAEQRRKRRKKGKGASGPSSPADDDPEPAPAEAPRATAGEPDRRPPLLAPREAENFDGAHPLVGQVVVAEIAFDGIDPDRPELDRKRRPAVVIGVAEDELLVRPGYSEGGLKARTWQSVELRDWRAAGLHARTWIELDARRIPRADASAPVGRLSVADWNSLW